MFLIQVLKFVYSKMNKGTSASGDLKLPSLSKEEEGLKMQAP